MELQRLRLTKPTSRPKEAYQAVFADASGFNQQEYDADAADKMVADAGYDDTIDDVEQAVDKDGNALGYVITVTAKDGSYVKYYIFRWYQNDGTVNGYSITDISETPGLGMKAEEEDFYSQFENKTVDKFTVVKQNRHRMIRLRQLPDLPLLQRQWQMAVMQPSITSRMR